MLRDTAVTLIKGRLKNNSNTSLDALIVAEMVAVQEGLFDGAVMQPWFTEKLNSTLATVAETKTLTLPSDFNRLTAEGGIWVTDSAGNKAELVRGDYDEMESDYAGADSGLPKKYAMVGGTVYLYPTPEAVYSVEVLYHQKGLSLETSNIENIWLEHASDWFMGEVGLVIAGQYLADKESAAFFANQAQIGKDRVNKLDTAHGEAGRYRAEEA